MSLLRPVANSHKWNFFRTGGLDQVALTTTADLLALDQLDQKLWVALSCPVKGLELDEKTLALIDTDGDGRIRVPELLTAVKWAAARLKDPSVLLRNTDALPLEAIDNTKPEGAILLSSAKQILVNLGKKDAAGLTVAEAADTAKIFSASPLNGDGVIPPEATDDAAVQALIKDIIACIGGTADRTGSVGVTAKQIDAFFAELSAYVDWVQKSATKEIAILGENTDAACTAIRAVRAKVDDYFTRTRLAAYDQRAVAALNRNEAEYVAIAAKDLKVTADEVASFPLAHVEPGRALPLLEQVNPAWSARLADLQAKAVSPLFGPAKTDLTAAEWTALNAQFAAYETWLGGKTGGAVEKLGLPRVREILASEGRAALTALVAKDEALAPEFKAVSDVERLARYYRDLRTLLHNFVNFSDFYSRDRYAIFQAGTLYFDSRATEFCLRVDAVSPLAAMSKLYIAYCTCTRAGSPAMNLAACVTQGDSDYIFVGRHGIFYDRQGRDWDAVVTSIVENPISIRQAFWSPYKKFLRFVEEQLAKRAAAAEAATTDKLSTAAATTAHLDQAPPPPAAAAPVAGPKKFDLALVTGIGVAIGSIGAAITAILAKFVDVPAWKIAVLLFVLMLVISLPSMAIAWLKLRQRTLGPLLDANGWAINGRVKINIPFGTTLTSVAKIPVGSHRSLEDPYEDKEAARQRRLATALTILLVLVASAFWIRWDRLHRGRYFWQPAPAVVPATVPAAAPAAPAGPEGAKK